MIWGRLAWNVWWAGDARTNLELILGLLYVGYLMLRAYLPEREKRARLSTVFGFLAVLDVPINYGAIYWWDTQHPKPVLGPRGGGADPDIKLAIYVSLIAFTIVYTWLSDEEAGASPDLKTKSVLWNPPWRHREPRPHARTHRRHRRLHRRAGRTFDFHGGDVQQKKKT